jgi:small subunit ribosomal protein S16
MKKMGRRHRPFYRICAMDARRPRDGRVLEELGTYDPMVPDADARALLNGQRIQYWLSVGAQPSEKVKVLIKKYGHEGTHLEQQKAALDRLAQSRRRPEPPSHLVQPAETAEGDQPAAESAKGDQPAAESAKGDQPSAESAQSDQPPAEEAAPPDAEQPSE